MSGRLKIVNIGLLAAGAVLLGVLAVGLWRKAAEAQMVFQAGPVIAVTGAQSGSNVERPLYILDSTTQCLIVYVYQPQENYIRLAAARKVLDDLQLNEYANRGMTVEQIKLELEKIRKR